MPQMSNRIQLFTDSVIRRMTRISDACQAINLSQGFPDFPPPKALTDTLKQIADNGPHQYSVTYGADNVREAIAQKASPVLHHNISAADEVLVTCGSTEAMMCAMMTVCNPGDKVAIFSPFYENYMADTILCGAEPVFIPLVPPAYQFDPGLLEQAFQQGAKALILCNPSNPCGKVFTRQELEQIAALAIQYDTFVITDEVYEHIIYAPHQHIAIASLPDMWERTITCNSLSKTYSITGWRLGYLIASAAVMDGCRKVHDFLTVGAPSPLQEAAVTALHFPPSYYTDLQRLYTHKRSLFLNGLDQLHIPHNTPEATYYVLIDISAWLNLPQFSHWSDLEFCEWMTEHIGVAAVPGSGFFREPVNHLIRLHFSRADATLEEALRRLAKLSALLNEG